MTIRAGCLFLCLLATTTTTTTAAAATVDVDALKPGQAVEVREGDTWSKARFVKREGRKLQIRYLDGTEEWVTADRLRGGAAGATATTKPAAQEVFANGAKVEVKSVNAWKPASVKNRDGELYLIQYDDKQRPSDWEWAHVEFVRKVGSDKDSKEWGSHVGVGGVGVANAKEQAKRRLAQRQAEKAAVARGEEPPDRREGRPAFDKPIKVVTRDDATMLRPAVLPATLAQFDPATQRLAERGYLLAGQRERGLRTVGPANMLFGGSHALLVQDRPGASNPQTWAELLDLAAGRSLGVINFEPFSNPVAMSPSGKRVAGVELGNLSNRLDVFDLAAGRDLKHVVSFRPYNVDGVASIKWVGFVDDDHVLTYGGGGGQLVLWDVAKPKAIWRMMLTGGGDCTLSPGCRQLAVRTDYGLVILDALKGTTLCAIAPARRAANLAFTPDGKRVVGCSGPVVFWWDLAKGTFGGDIAIPPDAYAAGRVSSTADSRFVLVGGNALLDLDRKLVVWDYLGGKSHRTEAAGHGGRTFSVISDIDGRQQRLFLLAAAIPHPSAKQAADAIPPGAGLAVQPGGSVRIEVAPDWPGENARRKIVSALSEQLARAGVAVDPASPVRLYVRTGDAAGGGPGRKLARMGYEHGGKVLWETNVLWLPGQENQINYWLANEPLPTYVAVAGDKPTSGQSRWTVAQGPVDQRRASPPPAGVAPIRPAR